MLPLRRELEIRTSRGGGDQLSGSFNIPSQACARLILTVRRTEHAVRRKNSSPSTGAGEQLGDFFW